MEYITSLSHKTLTVPSQEHKTFLIGSTLFYRDWLHVRPNKGIFWSRDCPHCMFYLYYYHCRGRKFSYL